MQAERLQYIGLGDCGGYVLADAIDTQDAAVLDTKTGIVYIGHMSGGSRHLARDVETAIENGEIPDA